jgi:GT2 family glycosyltransferase
MGYVLSIIIVNYKTPDLTIRCIKSIPIDSKIEVIVVDNDSNDGSIEQISSKFDNIKILKSTYNSGFGRANNLGVKNANGEYILLLNSDMLLLPNNNLQDCINQFYKDTNIGVLGCKLLNEDSSFQKSTYYDVATLKNLLSYNILWFKIFKPKPTSLDAIMGSFMIFRKKDFENLSGFDEDFFMYAEELELCARFKKSGKKILYFDQYTAIHKHGGSSEGSNWSLKQNLLSNALLQLKVNGFLGYLFYHLVFQINILTNVLLYFTLDKMNRKSYNRLYYAYFSNYLIYFKIPFYYTFFRNRKFLKAI